MSIRTPFTTAASSAERVFRTRTQAKSLYPSWKQLFRPCTLGFIGLAIAVVLLGVGYKLSLYHRHAASSSRVPVVKMLMETRNASITAIFKFKGKPHLTYGSPALSAPIQRCPCLNRSIAYILPVCRRRVTYFDFLIPFRSPPSLRFSLA